MSRELITIILVVVEAETVNSFKNRLDRCWSKRNELGV